MGSIRKRGDSYHAQVRLKGWQSFTKTFPSRKLAKLWIEKTESQLREHPAKTCFREDLTLKEACNRYAIEISANHKGRSVETARLRFLAKGPLGELRLRYISSSQIKMYFQMRQINVKEATIRKEFILLRRVFSTAIESWNISIASDPMKQLKVPKDSKNRERRISCEEWERILTVVGGMRNPIIKAVIQFAYETGMRRSELLKLKWDDLGSKICILRDTKNGSNRTIPLSGNAMQILESLERTSERIFPISGNAIRLSWERIVKKAEINDLRFHDMRHEAISRFFEMGMSIAEVQVISGHKDVRQLFRYTHIRPETIVKQYFK